MKKKLLLYFSILSLSSFSQTNVNINGEAAFDLSGKSVSISSDGNVVAIGAYLNDGNGDRSGQVRVYENKNGVWTQLGADINGEAIDDQSGISVSLSSDGYILAIGASGNNGDTKDYNQTSICNYTNLDYGHVRVYKYSNNNWTQIGLDIDGEAAGDRSGISVSLSSHGNIVAIGAIGNKDNGLRSGHVRVYQNINGNWSQIGQDIDGKAAGDMLGYSVSLSSDGSIVAMGAIITASSNS